MRTLLRRTAALGALFALVLTLLAAAPAGAASPPTVPFDDTGDLYFIDDRSDSILKVTSAGSVSVALSNTDIQTALGTASVEFNDSSLAFGADGSLYFMVKKADGTFVIAKRAAGGGVSAVVTQAEISAATGGTPTDHDFYNFAIAPDGSMIVTDEAAGDVVRVSGGTVTMLADQTALAAAAGEAVTLDADLVIDGSGNAYIGKEAPGAAILKIASNGTVTKLDAKPNHVVSVVATGNFTLSYDGQTTGSISGSAPAADVETAFEGLTTVDDVSVTGAGTASDPYLIEFIGSHAGAEAKPVTTDAGATAAKEVTGGKFGDVDSFMTRDPNGNLTVLDGGNHWVWTVNVTTGAVTTLLDEYDITRVAPGGSVGLDAGLAWDDAGVLHLAVIQDASPDQGSILRRATNGSLSVFVSSADIRAATAKADQGIPDGGLAFAPVIASGGGGGGGGDGGGGSDGGGGTDGGGGGSSPPAGDASGYRMIAADGGVFVFGNRKFHGSTGGMVLNKPVVGGATNPAGFDGYWLVASDGGIFAFGDAGFYGSLGDRLLDAPVVEIEPTPSGKGYWLVTAKGQVFAFGDAKHYGDAANINLNSPIIGMSTTTSGMGYWLLGEDGGIFSFGDAKFWGSTGGMKLNAPVVDLQPIPGDKGYYLVALDGGVFSFGAAVFKGSTGGMKLNAPVVAMLVTGGGSGYWLAATDGGLFSFGAGVPFHGSTGDIRLNSPVNDLIF